MATRALLISFVLVSQILGCSSGNPGKNRDPVAQASESDAVVAYPDLGDVLGTLSTVYVPIDPGSLRSLDVALEEKGYGNVTASDLKRQFIYSDTSFGRAMVAYSTDGDMAPNSLYETMSPAEWLQFALADESSAGVVLDPGRHPVALEKKDIGAVLDRLAR